MNSFCEYHDVMWWVDAGGFELAVLILGIILGRLSKR